MEEKEIREVLEEYKDAHTPEKLVSLLTEELIEELESMPAENERQKHNLNLKIRNLEEELDWVENNKLAEFDPEQQ